jgi:undecaprenyl-diphosphatase
MQDMARKKNIKQDYKQRLNVISGNNYIYIAVIGIILSYASIFLDQYVTSIFKYNSIPVIGALLAIMTNFGTVLLLFLAIPAVILYKKDNRKIKFLALAITASFLVSLALKLVFIRQRPIEVFDYPFISIINYSFPSMHSMIVFALLPLLMNFFPKKKAYWAALALLVAFTRIYFSFHYLSDVVFGIFSGYLIGEFLLSKYYGGINAKPKTIRA